MRKGWAAFCLLLGLSFLSGCWDRVEIEERGFVVGAGIDMAGEEEQGKGKYVLTFQFVIPGGLQGKEGGGKDGRGSGGEAFFNLSSTGNTMFMAARDMSYTTSRSPYLQHIRMIIISEEMAKDGDFVKTLDLFLRDHEMRRATKVMISEEDTRELLNVKPKSEKLPVVYFESVAQNPTKSSRIYPPVNIGDVQSFIIGKKSFALPRMRKMGNEVSIAGAAIFNGSSNRLLGYLEDDETSGLNLLRGSAQDGVLEFKLDNEYVAFEIKGSRREITADVSDPERIRFTIKINMEGNVGETQEQIDLMDPSQLAKIKREAESELLRLTTSTVEKLQREFATDVMELGDYLKQEYFSVWKDIEDNWDHGENIFAKSEITIETKVHVRIIGSTVETK
ncbi:Ger(x)C family spore germination protein [Paenibacillus macerans]|uniref:Ger(x)C family spore germination protein n=1 Tax=Paenibacillus macerans TaxID=44252 RepID=UPI003D31E787